MYIRQGIIVKSLPELFVDITDSRIIQINNARIIDDSMNASDIGRLSCVRQNKKK